MMGLLTGLLFILFICAFIPFIGLVVDGDIDLKPARTKIKDFFYPKYEEDNMYYNPNKPVSPPEPPTHSDTPEYKDLREFKEELNNLDKKIKYVEQLKELEKQKRDKELYLERLYAGEEDFETLYAVICRETSSWNPIHENGSRWVHGIYQTRVEAESEIADMEDARIEVFRYLPSERRSC